MKIREIVDTLDAEVVCGESHIDEFVTRGFASDLMSDVLTLDTDEMVLITGLANMQTIRTVEMADVKCILFVRNKQVTPQMLELAQEEDLVLIRCKYSMFNAVGKLYTAGLSPVY
ncbi:DRTGG domain-containing protein [Labilibacter marinus]|uniref:DRTGG domain-containing protein n=1 Tax=Labilibacter marinus TaxID=1477105 RepID=UPI0008359C79|nr:DRTGG domain-containing protein [Labilibacter marinus]